jgi:glycerol uptake facilitator-like aquaporin
VISLFSFLQLIGISANIQSASVSISLNSNSPVAAALLGSQFAWGFGFALAVYSAAQISGLFRKYWNIHNPLTQVPI